MKKVKKKQKPSCRCCKDKEEQRHTKYRHLKQAELEALYIEHLGEIEMAIMDFNDGLVE